MHKLYCFLLLSILFFIFFQLKKAFHKVITKFFKAGSGSALKKQLDPDPQWEKLLDPDQQNTNAIHSPAGQGKLRTRNRLFVVAGNELDLLVTRQSWGFKHFLWIFGPDFSLWCILIKNKVLSTFFITLFWGRIWMTEINIICKFYIYGTVPTNIYLHK